MSRSSTSTPRSTGPDLRLNLIRSLLVLPVLTAAGLGFLPVSSGVGPLESRAALPVIPVPGPVVDPGAGPDVAAVRVADFGLERNARVEYWLGRFTTDQRPTMALFLSRLVAYEGYLAGRIAERGLPSELLFLAMMESGLNPEAVSDALAVGLWQFMDVTALQYGLRIDEWVDERRDPVAATGAALDFLEYLHGRYGSWHLAAAAYNAGPSRVDQTLAEAGLVERLDPFTVVPGGDAHYWTILASLPFETRHYVPRIVAATLIARDPVGYGFGDVLSESIDVSPLDFEPVWVPGGTSFRAVARALGVPVHAVHGLNPHLVLGMTPPGDVWSLRVPRGSAGRVVAAFGVAGSD